MRHEKIIKLPYLHTGIPMMPSYAELVVKTTDAKFSRFYLYGTYDPNAVRVATNEATLDYITSMMFDAEQGYVVPREECALLRDVGKFSVTLSINADLHVGGRILLNILEDNEISVVPRFRYSYSKPDKLLGMYFCAGRINNRIIFL